MVSRKKSLTSVHEIFLICSSIKEKPFTQWWIEFQVQNLQGKYEWKITIYSDEWKITIYITIHKESQTNQFCRFVSYLNIIDICNKERSMSLKSQASKQKYLSIACHIPLHIAYAYINRFVCVCVYAYIHTSLSIISLYIYMFAFPLLVLWATMDQSISIRNLI